MASMFKTVLVNPSQVTFDGIMPQGAQGSLESLNQQTDLVFQDILAGIATHGRTCNTGHYLIYEEIETLKPNKWFCGALIQIFL